MNLNNDYKEQSDDRNQPLEVVAAWALISACLVIADFFGCLVLQAMVDHVLKIEN